MNKEEIRNLRWEKIEKFVSKARDEGLEGSFLLLMSPTGCDVVSLPKVTPNVSLKSMLHQAININTYVDNPDVVKKMAMSFVELIFNKKIISFMEKHHNKYTMLAWGAVGYFYENGDCVEVFEDQDVVFLDFNLLEVSANEEVY